MTEKYGVVYNSSIHHAADQRSIDCPGHGYGAYTETIKTFEEFDSKEKLLIWAGSYYNQNRSYNAYKLIPVQITKTLNVELKE